MCKLTLVVSMVTVMAMCGLSVNGSSLEIVIENLKKACKAQLNSKPAAPACPTGTIHKCVVEKAKPQPTSLELVESKLTDIENQLDSITQYLSREKETDRVLKERSDEILKDMAGKTQETDYVIHELKQSVKKSIDNFEGMIREVNKSAQVTINSKGVIFYSHIGSPCTQYGNECLDENSECRASKCQCQPGYSLDLDDRACVKKCDTYGTTYQSVRNFIIRGFNNLTLEKVEDAEECKKKCNEETDFLCKSLDYFPRWSQCFLSEFTVLDVPDEAWEYSSVGVHLQRDCQF